MVAALLSRNTQVYKCYYLLEALNSYQRFVTLACVPDVAKLNRFKKQKFFQMFHLLVTRRSREYHAKITINVQNLTDYSAFENLLTQTLNFSLLFQLFPPEWYLMITNSIHLVHLLYRFL